MTGAPRSNGPNAVSRRSRGIAAPPGERRSGAVRVTDIPARHDWRASGLATRMVATPRCPAGTFPAPPACRRLPPTHPPRSTGIACSRDVPRPGATPPPHPIAKRARGPPLQVVHHSRRGLVCHDHGVHVVGAAVNGEKLPALKCACRLEARFDDATGFLPKGHRLPVQAAPREILPEVVAGQGRLAGRVVAAVNRPAGVAVQSCAVSGQGEEVGQRLAPEPRVLGHRRNDSQRRTEAGQS